MGKFFLTLLFKCIVFYNFKEYHVWLFAAKSHESNHIKSQS